MAEIQEILKGLLAHGAKLPKPLMLYVKNLLFLDSAVAALAPDLNLFAEVGRIYGYFVQNHSEKILRDIGFDPRHVAFDIEGFRRGLGLTEDVEEITHRDLLGRRKQVQQKLEKSRPSFS